jgi:hypothetical protein
MTKEVIRHVFFTSFISAISVLVIIHPAIAEEVPSAVEPAIIIGDSHAVERGSRLASEACEIVLGPDRPCKFEITAGPEMSVGFDSNTNTVLASPEFLAHITDDQLRASFAWAVLPDSHNLEELARVLKKIRFGTGVTVIVVTTAGVVYLLLQYNVAGVDGIEYLIAGVVVPVDATIRVVNYNILESTRSSIISSKDKKTMKALAKNGYEPESLIGTLEKVHTAQENDREREDLIGLLKRFYVENEDEEDYRDHGLGGVDEDRIEEAKAGLSRIEKSHEDE